METGSRTILGHRRTRHVMACPISGEKRGVGTEGPRKETLNTKRFGSGIGRLSTERSILFPPHAVGAGGRVDLSEGGDK